MERIIVYPDELYHYGRKGMKWGQSIYGSKQSGSSGKASAKKTLSIKERFSKATGAKTKAKLEDKTPKAPQKKSIKDMTDQELKDRKARVEAEYNLIQAERKLAELTPKKVSIGRKMVESTWNDVLAPAAKSAGKDLAEKYMKKYGAKALGLDEKTTEDGFEALKKASQVAGFKAIIAENQNKMEKAQEEIEERKKKKQQAQ